MWCGAQQKCLWNLPIHQNHSMPDKLTSKRHVFSCQSSCSFWKCQSILACEETSYPLFSQVTGMPVCSQPISLEKRKKSLDLGQTTLHGCLNSAGWPALPQAPSLGTHEPTSRAAHCRSYRAVGCSQLRHKQMSASLGRAVLRLEGTAEDGLVQAPRQRWVKP